MGQVHARTGQTWGPGQEDARHTTAAAVAFTEDRLGAGGVGPPIPGHTRYQEFLTGRFSVLGPEQSSVLGTVIWETCLSAVQPDLPRIPRGSALAFHKH